MIGNHSKSALAQGSLTVTPTGGASTKVGYIDPVYNVDWHPSTETDT
ncbi:hypothetical protein EUBVEN_00036 [Eubacterium ventriosum ATCC 27560]|uniref:Uncharacterized protein n=1 Tax=Eubacterium ventriosum ATCC 27560 TaxID=411463 RepID=A5Z306_9FIRM|nr:hypothetical protein EUBVEN_00036 [Eubacterium ventriosum ATCC 27560]